MSKEPYKYFTRTYYDKRNAGMANHSDVTDWEYEYYGLEWPDGYTQDPREEEYHTRLGNKRKILADPWTL